METMQKPKTEVLEDQIVLANDSLRLTFTRARGSVYLSGLSTTAPGSRNWITAGATRPAPLWKAKFLHQHFLPPDATSRNRWDMRMQEDWVDVDSFAQVHFSANQERQGDASVLTFCWEGIDLAGTGDTADVSVQVSLADGSQVSRWSAQMSNKAIRFNLWQMLFPVVGNLVGDTSITLITPAGWGKAVKHPSKHPTAYNGHYPSGHCVMQLICLTDDRETVYFAPDDLRAHFKQFKVEGQADSDTIQYAVVQFPNDMSYMRNSFTTPYAVNVGVLPGD